MELKVLKERRNQDCGEDQKNPDYDIDYLIDYLRDYLNYYKTHSIFYISREIPV